MWKKTIARNGRSEVVQVNGPQFSHPRGRGRERGRGRGGRNGRAGPRGIPRYPPIVRPIFDWSEVRPHFPQAAPVVDTELISQLIQQHVQDITPTPEQRKVVLGFCNKVVNVVENMILTGEGEHLLLEEVRPVGSYKKNTALSGTRTADVVVLFKTLPSDKLVEEVGEHIANIINMADEEQRLMELKEKEKAKEKAKDKGKDKGKDDEPMDVAPVQPRENVTMAAGGKSFELLSHRDAVVVRVYTTSTADVVYNQPPEEIMSDFHAFANALRMIRHTRWWEEQAMHISSIHSVVRILKHMQRHVPGLSHLSCWYIELLSHCAVIPLVGSEPLSVMEALKRVFQLLSAGLFLPGSVGIPDPCEEGDEILHENLTAEQCDELTCHAQRILILMQFGIFREVLGCQGAEPTKFDEPYSFGGITLQVAPPLVTHPPPPPPPIVPAAS